jgi:hypothetical protein
MTKETLTREQVEAFDTFAIDSITIGQLKRTCLAAMDKNKKLTDDLLRAEVEWSTQQAEVERLKDYVGDEMLKSDFQTAGQMRAEVERLRALIKDLPCTEDYCPGDGATCGARRALGGTDAD